MTRVRAPLSFEKALTRIASLIGWDGCASVTGKSESLMRKWASPDPEREISLRDALRLDQAYQREGGEGAPLHECYTMLLELESPGLCLMELMHAASAMAKESGEAVSAAIAAGQTGNQQSFRAALSEAEQSAQASNALVVALKQRLDQMTGGGVPA